MTTTRPTTVDELLRTADALRRDIAVAEHDLRVGRYLDTRDVERELRLDRAALDHVEAAIAEAIG